MNIILGNQISRKIKFLIKRISRNMKKRNEITVVGSSKDKIEAIYIINLDRQNNRWKQFKKEAQIQKVKKNKTFLDFCYRISAVDGKELKFEEINSNQILNSYKLKDQYYVDPDPRLLSIIREKSISIELTKEEIAVALSHIKAWQRIIDENKSYALILEDDVFFENEFATKLNEIWQELPIKTIDDSKFDLLYLSFREVDRGAEKKYFSKNLFRPIRGLWWLSGYVLSLSGAKKLLNELPVCGPVDLWINRKFKKLDVYASVESIIFQRVDLKSDNNYSILPILSQIGIQSDTTHLSLDQKKGKNPVFVINIDEIGSEVIGNALNLLGYRCCINRWQEFSTRINTLIKNNEPLLFDAYIGFSSIITHYKELDSLYPNAVFILIYNQSSDKTDRHKDDSSDEIDIQTQVIENKIYDEIQGYFLERKEKLLTINIHNLTSWEQLYGFLKCKPQKYLFPNENYYLNNNISFDINQATLIPVEFSKKKYLEHDVHPWIIPLENIKNFCVTNDDKKTARFIGSYKKILSDNLYQLDDSIWTILDNSFPSNLAQFTKRNVLFTENKGLEITLRKEKCIQKEYTSASITTKKRFLYGRFTVQMKPLKANGIITAFFLHRNDPWQEIDFEFLGNDTTKILLNVYYNPGIDGSNCNYGNRGTPTVISLNFDASEEYHEYTIEWEPHEIRWYVDKSLIDVRATWEPTPIPEQPMSFFINTWPSRSEELVGNIVEDILPKSSFIKHVDIHSWLCNSIKNL